MSQRWKPAVTVAAVVEREGRYLVVEEQTRGGVRFNNPAGHLEPGESPLQAVVREVLEETACHFTPQALVGVYLARSRRPQDAHDETYVRFSFTGTVSEPVPGLALDTGIVRALWMTAAEVRACAQLHRSPLLLRGMEDHEAGRRFPLDLVWTDATVFGD